LDNPAAASGANVKGLTQSGLGAPHRPAGKQDSRSARIMRGNIAIVREALSKLPNVSQTWFEWSWEDAMWVKTLVIEVEFDTDPSSPSFSQLTLDAIEETVIGVLNDDRTMTVSYLHIVPKGRRRQS
jgi:hypothetical protein